MKKLFLTSSFAQVSDIFEQIFGEQFSGKTVTFIPTASLKEDIKFYVNDARQAFLKMGIIIDELEISKASKEEIVYKIQKNDFIYISGGNTFFLLQELQNSGADKIIIDEVLNGKIYVGESAGSMIAGPNINYVKEMDDENIANNLFSKKSLGLVDFFIVPHFGNFPFEESTKNIVEKYSNILNLKPISNNEAIFIQGNNIKILKN